MKKPLILFNILFIAVLTLGIFFRFYNLDKKVYWFDETITSLRSAGYTETELIQQTYNGNEIGSDTLKDYLKTNSTRGFFDVIKSLAREDSQHPPLYFLILQLWMKLFGSSTSVIRSLSAIFSFLTLPLIYWLCVELFESHLTAKLATLLIAISPFHVLYAQEAREYSLWIATTLLSSVTFLRAIRINTRFTWCIYAISVITSLYAFLFSGFILISHLTYLLIKQGFKLNKIIIYSLLSYTSAIIVFMPWLIVVLINYKKVSKTTDWSTQRLPILLSANGTDSLVYRWMLNISRLFIDIDNKSGNFLTFLLIGLTTALTIYSLYFLYKKSSPRIWIFILTLIAILAFSLMIPDVIFRWQRSAMSRYLFPSYLGIQIAVAYVLSKKIVSQQIWQKRLWSSVMVMLISSGIISCILSSQSEGWWNKIQSYSIRPVARTINAVARPLVISDTSVGNILPLTWILDSDVKLKLLVKPKVPVVPENFNDIFLYKASGSMQEQLKSNYRIEKVKDLNNLKRLVKK